MNQANLHSIQFDRVVEPVITETADRRERIFLNTIQELFQCLSLSFEFSDKEEALLSAAGVNSSDIAEKTEFIIKYRVRKLLNQDYSWNLINGIGGGHPDDYSGTFINTLISEDELRNAFELLFSGTSIEVMKERILIDNNESDPEGKYFKKCSKFALIFFDFIQSCNSSVNNLIGSVNSMINIKPMDRVKYHPDSHPLVQVQLLNEESIRQIITLFLRSSKEEVSTFGNIGIDNKPLKLGDLLEFIKNMDRYKILYKFVSKFQLYVISQTRENRDDSHYPAINSECIADIYRGLCTMSLDPALEEMQGVIEWAKAKCERIMEIESRITDKIQGITSSDSPWYGYFPEYNRILEDFINIIGRED